jgi:hypothetical protein
MGAELDKAPSCAPEPIPTTSSIETLFQGFHETFIEANTLIHSPKKITETLRWAQQ